jgi:hypothetical protein
MAFHTNKMASDIKGCTLSSSYLGLTIVQLGYPDSIKEAFEWFEISFGYAYRNDERFGELKAIENMFKVAKRSINNASEIEKNRLINVAKYYQKLSEAKHIIHHFNHHSKPKHFADCMLLEEVNVRNRFSLAKSKFNSIYWKESIALQLIEEIHQWIDPMTLEEIQKINGNSVSFGQLNGAISEVRISKEFGAPKIEISIDIENQFITPIGENGIGLKSDYRVEEIIKGNDIDKVLVETLPGTNEIQVVLAYDTDNKIWIVKTVFPGIYAPPYPRNNQDNENENKLFWDQHVHLEKISYGN